MGIARAGGALRLSRAFTPDVAAITQVAPAHLQTSVDRRGRGGESRDPGGSSVRGDLRRERRRLARGRDRGALARPGDPLRADASAEVHGGSLRDAATGTRGSACARTPDEARLAVALPLPGAHQVVNFLAASAVAFAAGAACGGLRGRGRRTRSGRPPRGVPAARLRARFSTTTPTTRTPRRCVRRSTRCRASPAKRRIAVLGDMRELGPEEDIWHRELGKYASARADRLVCVGRLARSYGEEAVDCGFPRSAIVARGDSRRTRRPTARGTPGRRGTSCSSRARGPGLDRPWNALGQAAASAEGGVDALPLALSAREGFPAFNVFRYITFRTAMAAVTALLLALALGPPMIRLLKRRQIGQSIREDGPRTHLSKAGTPTMGGILILLAVIARDAPLDGPHEPAGVDRARARSPARRRGVRGRLRQGHAAAQPRALRPRKARPAVPRGLRRGVGDRAVGGRRHVLDARDVSFFKTARCIDLGSVYIPFVAWSSSAPRTRST